MLRKCTRGNSGGKRENEKKRGKLGTKECIEVHQSGKNCVVFLRAIINSICQCTFRQASLPTLSLLTSRIPLYQKYLYFSMKLRSVEK
jgi:hypothetical protein